MIVIIISLLTACMLYSIYLLWRNRKVLKFRLSIIDLCYEYNIKHRDEGIRLHDKHSYDKMLFSFKPLTLESWFTKEEIERVKR